MGKEVLISTGAQATDLCPSGWVVNLWTPGRLQSTRLLDPFPGLNRFSSKTWPTCIMIDSQSKHPFWYVKGKNREIIIANFSKVIKLDRAYDLLVFVHQYDMLVCSAVLAVTLWTLEPDCTARPLLHKAAFKITTFLALFWAFLKHKGIYLK